MNELEEKIYNEILSREEFTYSTNISEKHLETLAIESLKNKGNILVKTESLGYIIAKAF